jgi:hypothetical protein
VPLAISSVILAMAIVKNIRDEASAWPSYLGIAFAGVMVAGTFIEWVRNRSEESPAQSQWQPQPAGPSDASPIATDRRSDEQRW